MRRLGQFPFRRFAIEAAVIIASVLAAFGIQAWWDDRLEREEERRVLSALLDEVRENQRELGRMTRYHEDALVNTSALMLAGAGTASSVSSDSLDLLLSHASGWQVSAYSRSALDVALLGGKLPIISSPRLARALTRWQRELELGLEFERDHKDFMWQTWMPFLRINASIPQISNAQTRQLGGGEAYASETPVAFSRDHSALLRSQEFHNLLQQKKWQHEDALRIYGARVGTGLNDLAAALELELR